MQAVIKSTMLFLCFSIIVSCQTYVVNTLPPAPNYEEMPEEEAKEAILNWADSFTEENWITIENNAKKAFKNRLKGDYVYKCLDVKKGTDILLFKINKDQSFLIYEIYPKLGEIYLPLFVDQKATYKEVKNEALQIIAKDYENGAELNIKFSNDKKDAKIAYNIVGGSGSNFNCFQ